MKPSKPVSYKIKSAKKRKAPVQSESYIVCNPQPAPPPPGMDRLHVTLQPGCEFLIDFGLAKGRVLLSYPNHGNPRASVWEQADGLPETTEFERVKFVEALLEEGKRDEG